MSEVRNEYRQLFEELTVHEKKGRAIKIGNKPASPMQIITEIMVKEKSNYMRDYVIDDQGNIKELCFHEVKKEK